MVGKYVQMRDSYMSLHEALMHGGIKTRTRVNIHYIESTDIEQHGTHALKGMDAILVPGGFGERGIEGKIPAVRYAREHGIPYLGICLGMQVAIVEFARHVLGLDGRQQHRVRSRDAASGDRAHHRMAGPGCRLGEARRQVRQGRHHAPGRPGMLLGAGTRAREIFGKDTIMERHRHRYEFNNNYPRTAPRRRACGSPGFSRDGLVEVIEIAQPSVVRRDPVPPGVHLDPARRPSAVHRLHPRRARSCGHQLCRKPRGREPRMKLADTRSASAAVLPHRGPLRHRERSSSRRTSPAA